MFLEAVGNIFPNGHTSKALYGTKKTNYALDCGLSIFATLSTGG